MEAPFQIAFIGGVRMVSKVPGNSIMVILTCSVVAVKFDAHEYIQTS